MLGGVTPDELPVGHDPRQTEYEVALINRYFEKARRWREGEIDVPRRALLDLNFAPDDAVGGPDAYSHLAPIVGIDRMFSRQFDANAVYDPLNPGLSSNTAGWLFGFGAGPGYADFQTCAGVLQPQAFDQASGAVRTVVNALSGSFFADWDRADNLLRSVIAARGYAITSMAGGRPAPLLHTLAMGETFGQALFRTANAPAGAYHHPADLNARGTTTSLLGDPTLRINVVKPPTNLRAIRTTMGGNPTITVSWDASADASRAGFLGYLVHRLDEATGNWELLTPTYITGTSFVENVQGGPFRYMVRAGLREGTVQPDGSRGTYAGTYQNLSIGKTVLGAFNGAQTRTFDVNYSTVNLATNSKRFGQSVVVDFLEDVGATLTADDLVVTLVGDDMWSPGALALQYFLDPASGRYVARFTFPNVTGGVRAGILPEGNYRAVVAADDVTWNGYRMAEDVVIDFFVKNADATQDRHTNLPDQAILFNQSNWGITGKPFTLGNFDYDEAGNVNLSDFVILRQHFNTHLAAPAEATASTSVSVLRTSEVLLQWKDTVAGETGWRVQMSEDGQVWDWWHNVAADSESYRVIGLEDGKRYWFRVRAYSDSATNPTGPNTAYSPKRAATTLLPSPTDFNFSWDGGTLLLSWSVNSVNASTAVIERSTDMTNWTRMEQSAGDEDFLDTGLEKGVVYYYRVYAKNRLIESGCTFAAIVGL